MKKFVNSIIYGIISILLFIGPKALFKVCEVGEKPMRCYWSTRAIEGLAIIVFVIAVVHFFANTIKEKILVNSIAVFAGAVIIAIPLKLIGGCNMNTMPCLATTFPAIYVLSILLILAAVIEIGIELWKRKKGETYEDKN